MARQPALELSWILPVYRTGEFVDELLRRIAQVSAALAIRHEIVLVDDACPAGGGDIAERAARLHRHVRVLRLPHNLGQDTALREGLRVARGDWAVMLDADLQDPPEALAALWAARAPGIGVLFAARHGGYSSRTRWWTSRLYRAATRWVGRLPRGACLYMLIDRPTIDAIAATRRPRLSMLAAIAGVRTGTICVPIQRDRRPAGRSAYGHLRRLHKAIDSLWQMLLAFRLRRSL